MMAPSLESDRLIYKPLSLEHLSQDYVDWMNDPDVNKYIESGGDYTLEKLRDFLEEVEERDILFWAIHIKSTGQHIGNIKIDPVIERHGLAEYGIMMGRKSEWGKGYAGEATRRIIDYCFSDIDIRKITLGVVTDNEAAYGLYKKMGFITEGIYKHHTLHDDKYRDVARMAIFNPKFEYDH